MKKITIGFGGSFRFDCKMKQFIDSYVTRFVKKGYRLEFVVPLLDYDYMRLIGRLILIARIYDNIAITPIVNYEQHMRCNLPTNCRAR